MNGTGIQKTSESQTISPSGFGKTRSCVRCQGLLVKEYFLDMKQDDSIWGSGWRCVNCGAIIASVLPSIRQHREMKMENPKFKQPKNRLSVSQRFVGCETHM